MLSCYDKQNIKKGANGTDEIFDAVFHAVRARLQSAGDAPTVIGIDGRCGSGKTTLGIRLSQIFPCRLFHTDDFYLPLELRPPDWTQQPGGNMDFARLRAEVLIPVRSGAVTYRPFDCRQGLLLAPITLPYRPLTIVEGSYAHHAALGDAYDLKIFLTCSADVQARRLKAREGSRFSVFEHRWIPMEERYIQTCGIGGEDTLVVDTSGAPPP